MDRHNNRVVYFLSTIYDCLLLMLSVVPESTHDWRYEPCLEPNISDVSKVHKQDYQL